MERNGQPAARPAESAPAIVRQEGPLATGEKLRPYALAAFTVVLVGLCVLLTVPFLPAVTWGVALAVVAWPLHAWVLRRAGNYPNWAAGLTAFVVVLAIVVPGAFVVQQIGREAGSAADRMRQQEASGTVREQMAHTPGLAGVVAWADRAGVDLDDTARRAVQNNLGDPATLAQGSVMGVIQGVLAVFILFYMLRDRRELLAGVRRLVPMRRAEADRVFEDAAGSVHANLYASLVTSAIDGATGGLLFWLLGLPSPVTWGVVMFVLSLLPVAGIILVWAPAAVYLALIGNWGGAAAMVAWGVGVSILVDTLLYTRLAGDRMRLHPVPMLLAFIGGLAVFGASGMILGPAILAVTVAVLEVWHYRAAGEEVPSAAEAAAEAKAAEEGRELTGGVVPQPAH